MLTKTRATQVDAAAERREKLRGAMQRTAAATSVDAQISIPELVSQASRAYWDARSEGKTYGEAEEAAQNARDLDMSREQRRQVAQMLAGGWPDVWADLRIGLMYPSVLFGVVCLISLLTLETTLIRGALFGATMLLVVIAARPLLSPALPDLRKSTQRAWLAPTMRTAGAGLVGAALLVSLGSQFLTWREGRLKEVVAMGLRYVGARESTSDSATLRREMEELLGPGKVNIAANEELRYPAGLFVSASARLGDGDSSIRATALVSALGVERPYATYVEGVVAGVEPTSFSLRTTSGTTWTYTLSASDLPPPYGSTVIVASRFSDHALLKYIVAPARRRALPRASPRALLPAAPAVPRK